MQPTNEHLMIEIKGIRDQVEAARSDFDIGEAVRIGMIEGARAVAADPEFADKFWAKGYEHLSSHAGKGASMWIGKRILTWAATTLVVVLLAWLVKSGAFK